MRAALLLLVACDGGNHRAVDGPIGDDDAPNLIDATPPMKPRLLSSAGGAFESFVVAGSQVYWSTTSTIERSPTAGTASGTPNVLQTSNAGPIALVNQQHVYWKVAGDRVERMALDGSNPGERPRVRREHELLGTLVDWNGTVVASATESNVEMFVSLPATSGATTMIAPFDPVIGGRPAIAAMGQDLYFGTIPTNAHPEIRHLRGATNEQFDGEAVPGVVFVDSTSVYWNDPIDFALYRKPRPGGAIERIGPALKSELCVFDDVMYWMNGDTLVKLRFHPGQTEPFAPAVDLTDLGPNGEDGTTRVYACSASGVFIGVEVASNPAPSFAVYAVP